MLLSSILKPLVREEIRETQAAHLLDAKGAIIGQASHPIDISLRNVEQGGYWLGRTALSSARLHEVSRIDLAMYFSVTRSILSMETARIGTKRWVLPFPVEWKSTCFPFTLTAGGP